MNSPEQTLSHHPAPHRGRVSLAKLVFGVVGGPLAWFVQFNAGYALASWPCFPADQRRSSPLEGYAWSTSAMIGALIGAVLVALAALWVSWHSLQRTREEGAGDHRHLMEVGAGRTRFLALWGVLLGGGFAIATLVTAVAFIVLPRCAG
jgi:hypothetical protein